MSGTVELVIDEIGAQGDGVALHGGERIFVPFAAPGDRIRATLGERRGEGREGRLVDLVAPGARAEPVCAHFGTCGGCALQHLDANAYAAAKLTPLRRALARQGLGEVPLAPLLRLPAGNRRRARLKLRRPRDARAPAIVGFSARATHQVIDMRQCAVLHPALFALVAPLRALATEMVAPGGEAAAAMTLTKSGVDLLVDLPGRPDLGMRESFAAFAAAQDLARLQCRGVGSSIEPIALRRPAQIEFGGVSIDLPPDAFLQASAEADAALSKAVLGGLDGAERIADLYAGIGTFSFALARQASVHAIEGAAPAVEALAAAARRAGLAARVTAERRDLERRPLSSAELARFDAVVLDPPRAGARAQSLALAASRVPRIAAVSCNAATFARDARILADGGYRLRSLAPIDAFLWSPHLELVGHFTRD